MCRALDATAKLHPDGYIEQETLIAAIQALDNGDMLICNVTAQNSAVIIRKFESSVQFDMFETSARSADVLASTRALIWNFPGRSVTIPLSTIKTTDILPCLAQFIHQASHETVHQYVAKVEKAGQSVAEYRDTADPSLISSVLATLLEVNGSSITPDEITKRVRDDVCFESKGNPWRRSPFWLALRVAAQLYLQCQLGDEVGRAVYKITMIILIRQLCKDLNAAGPANIDGQAFARAKLAYRLSKLAAQQSHSSSWLRPVLDKLLSVVQVPCKATIQKVNADIEFQWKEFKRRNRRPINRLQQHVPTSSLKLSLPNSKVYLMNILSNPILGVPQPAKHEPYRSSVAAFPLSEAMNHYIDLANQETQLYLEMQNGNEILPRDGFSFVQYSQEISRYLENVSNAYQGFPEGNSVMLLTVMELWIAMDKHAVSKYPLIEKHSIPFPPKMLEILHFVSLHYMRRLHFVETYLQKRRSKVSPTAPSLFDDPSPDSYAVRHFDQDQDLQNLRDSIIKEAAERAETKRIELEQMTEAYNKLAEREAGLSCITKPDPNYVRLRVHDDDACTKCYLIRKMRRMRIEVYEYPLPSNVAQQKAICFELVCPSDFATYRDTTWRLILNLHSLVNKRPPTSPPPWVKLPDHGPVRRRHLSNKAILTLASTTKSFTSSHYASLRLPVTPSQVCVPSACKMAMFDQINSIWVSHHQTVPSLSTLCTSVLPAQSPLQILQWDSNFASDKGGPTPNEVVASQSKCPSGINVGEFIAYQDLHAGCHLQWLQLLRELGSSNLNFSAISTVLLVERIALQSGPAKDHDPLRTKHWVFRNVEFCQALIDQVSFRVRAIASNWREAQCLETMLTLILRLLALAEIPEVRSSAKSLLQEIRAIAMGWVRSLRHEIHAAQDATVFDQRRKDAVWACLLVRRTFQQEAVFADRILACEAASDYIECSVILQQSLDESFTSLSTLLRNNLIRDWRLYNSIQFKLRNTLQKFPSTLSKALTMVGVSTSKNDTRLGSWSFSDVDDWCLSSCVTPDDSRSQLIEYNLASGVLLVDRQPLGKLPTEYRTSVVLKELFGNQPLLTYPSWLQGMSYKMAMSVHAHEVHFGFRNHDPIVRAVYGGSIFELIPREVFGPRLRSDLPGPLIADCFHWLDLRTGVLSVHQREDCWKSKASQWRLNLNNSQAMRRQSFLVDPQSNLFNQVIKNFEDFESPDHVVVYQPPIRSLSVQMTRLDLLFEVNRRGLLQSHGLNAEIDSDQDAGVWYGLRSKLVLRDVTNHRDRSIIIPLGTPTVKKFGIHVTVSILSSGEYARYSINPTLKRLDCSAEQALVYVKAQFHALTSFILPDPLTSCIGTEEAVRGLESAKALPWVPLSEGQRRTLTIISSLSPLREFYPPGYQAMQKVSWAENLSTHMQSDNFRPLVQDICQRSEMLQMFHQNKVMKDIHEKSSDPHLLKRAQASTLSYSHREQLCQLGGHSCDFIYDSRDRQTNLLVRQRVLEVMHSLESWSMKSKPPSNLMVMVQGWTTIRGFVGVYEKSVLSDIMTASMPQDWASMVNFCQVSNESHKYRLMFFFATLSAGRDVDMDAIRSLLAFAICTDLKDIEPPSCPEFQEYIGWEYPTASWLKQVLDVSRVPAPDEERYRNDPLITKTQQEVLLRSMQAHEVESNRQLASLIDFLVKLQWPDPELETCPPIQLDLISIDKAYDLIRIEWQRMSNNYKLSCFLQKAQDIMDKYSQSRQIQSAVHFHSQDHCQGRPQSNITIPSLTELLHEHPVNDVAFPSFEISDSAFTQNTDTKPEQPLSTDLCTFPRHDRGAELRRILEPFSFSKNTIRKHYGVDLERSLDAYLASETASQGKPGLVIREKLAEAIDAGLEKLRECEMFFEDAAKGDARSAWLSLGGLWPQFTPNTLLELLGSTNDLSFASGIRPSLIKYCLTLTAVQRLLRLEACYNYNRPQLLESELKNIGHTNWQPSMNKEWLILEIESNMMIRPEQLEVAKAIISPQSDTNSVLQMQMGQGKTSCIIPMAAATLANRERLLRVVVPKALLPQMAEILQGRLGGLLNRQVIHVPISRPTPMVNRFMQAFTLLL